MENLATQTLAKIVTGNHELVPVFEKYNLDFCCKGKRTLTEACNEKGILLDELMKELEAAKNATSNQYPFETMSADEIISYIIIQHHFYVKRAIPGILERLTKVATKHSDHFPFMIKVLELFTVVAEEMLQHMNKEEFVLFPRIRETVNGATSKPAGYIEAPVQVMEHEHDQAGTLLYQIRELTGGYSAPQDACTTFRVVLNELREYEEDLHRHVHLENNILFPMALNAFKN